MTPLIDMGQAEEFEPIPPGTYDFILSAWEYIEESASSGEPYIKFEYTVDEGEYQNRKVWRNRSVMPKALGYLKRDLVALGADPDVVSEPFDTDDVLPDLIGNPVRIKVSIRDYEGREVNDVDRIMPSEIAV